MSTLDAAAALEQLKALASRTDDPAVGEVVRVLGDALSVGNISNATGVAVGRNIRQIINHFDLPPEAAGALVQLRLMLGTSVPLDADQYQHGAIVAEKARDFVGREYVFNAIAEFLDVNSSGYFVIQADPGLGKSALIAEYVRRTGCIAHFNVRSLGLTRASQFIQNVCAQLVAEAQLPYTSLPAEATQDGAFLLKLLREASQALAKGDRLILAIDALDEVDLTQHPAGANILFLPATLPDRVYVVTTRRDVDLPFVVTSPQRVLDMMAYPAENRGDVEVFLTRAAERPGLRSWMSGQRLPVQEFVAKLADLSDGNFMYLRYVLPAIEQGTYRDLSIERLPVGLQGYYDDHWRLMGMTAKPLPRLKIRVVYILSEVRLPVTRKQVSEFASDDAMTADEITVQEVLDEWKQFLTEQRGGPTTTYGLYHASFRDFLHRKDIVQAAGVTIKGINALIANDIWKQL